ncbi:hypothetical protein Lser_V15G19826 [Lactuca serriola]
MFTIGGLLTLHKSMLISLGIYYFSMFHTPVSIYRDLTQIRARFFWGGEDQKRIIQWVKWEVILNDKFYGGFSIGILESFNQALMYKWRWRFLNNQNLLWVKIINSCYGEDGGFMLASSTRVNNYVWMGIVKSFWDLHNRGIIPFDSVCRKVGDGGNTKFWVDNWCGSISLRARFPRLFDVARNKDAYVKDYLVNNQWLFIGTVTLEARFLARS